ncbi:MAG: sialidase domain-containing protein [Candidatus Pristimantibacillus sp.]
MKKITSMLLAFILLITILPMTAMANEQVQDEVDPSLVFRVDNQQIYNSNYTNLSNKVDALKTLNEGTIIVRFRYSGSTIMSLFSLSNNTAANGHFQLYITPSAVGSENRFEKAGETSSNTHVKKDLSVAANEVHTLAMVVDQDQGYKYFLDGKLIMTDTTSARKFLSNIYAPNTAELGRTDRVSGNEYNFNGEIDFAELYSTPLADQDLLAITGLTSKQTAQNPMPADAKLTTPYAVFNQGMYGSNNYRIPALLFTEAGTLIAGIDKRISSGADSPANIDMMVRRSLDQGDTWETNGVLINNYPGNASNIDQSLMEDRETNRIFSLVLGFPDGGGYPTSVKGSGYKTINGNKYLVLLDSSGAEFTVRENDEVYNSSNVKTTYTVDELRNLYNNGVKVSNYFLPTSPLKPIRTSYLEMWHSDDEGLTWEGPMNLNPTVKEDWMAFIGAGPGNGIQLTQGPHAGRLVFPVYFTNENSSQNSAVIYSDDHGATWHRGESPNEGRIVNGVTMNERTSTGNELTEAQVAEMPDGQLKMFMRNYSGFAQIATSFDGGATWDSEVITERALVAPYCQMTVIRYDGQIDGKEALIFASPGVSSSRSQGTVKAGLIQESGTHANGRTKYTFDWKYSQLVKEGTYAYSSLTNLPNGEIGLFYEGSSNTEMSFIKFNQQYLKWQRQVESPAAKLVSIAIDNAKPEGYETGDKLRIKMVFDSFMMLSGNKSLSGTIGDTAVVLPLVSQNAAGTEFIFEASFPEMTAGTYPLAGGFHTNLKAYNTFGNEFAGQSNDNKLHAQIVAGNLEEQGAATQLTGASDVVSGESFDVQLGLRNLTSSIYAQDIKVTYDPAVMEFVTARSLIEGVNLIETVNQIPGTIRFLAASTGEGHAVSGDAEVLELTFKAKETADSRTGTIRVASILLGDANGVETEAVLSSLLVEVTPAVVGTPGDINNDGKVSIGDLAILAAHYGKDSTSSDWAQIKHMDLDRSGTIDIADLSLVAKQIMVPQAEGV